LVMEPEPDDHLTGEESVGTPAANAPAGYGGNRRSQAMPNDELSVSGFKNSVEPIRQAFRITQALSGSAKRSPMPLNVS
jgi:hypothetical protein